MLDGDPDRLRQVVDNLVVNALTYSHEGVVRVGVSDGDGRAVLTVHDEGPGIDPADLPSIFEPFFRSDPSRARSSGGAGLGLAIVAAIVRAHGGTGLRRAGPGRRPSWWRSRWSPTEGVAATDEESRPRHSGRPARLRSSSPRRPRRGTAEPDLSAVVASEQLPGPPADGSAPPACPRRRSTQAARRESGCRQGRLRPGCRGSVA